MCDTCPLRTRARSARPAIDASIGTAVPAATAPASTVPAVPAVPTASAASYAQPGLLGAAERTGAAREPEHERGGSQRSAVRAVLPRIVLRLPLLLRILAVLSAARYGSELCVHPRELDRVELSGKVMLHVLRDDVGRRHRDLLGPAPVCANLLQVHAAVRLLPAHHSQAPGQGHGMHRVLR